MTRDEAAPKPRRAWLPHPAGSLTLLALWLVIVGEVSVGQCVLGALVALVLPHVVDRFAQGPSVQIASWRAAWHLFWRVTLDIVTANLTVARLVLGDVRKLRPAFVTVPFELEHPTAIALFAGIITMTPGTVSCVVDRERRHIVVHVLDLDDADAAVQDMKARYEAPLKEIFGC